MILFKKPEDMLNKIVNDGTDIYNIYTGHYVFSYNEEGSICVYSLSNEDMDSLKDSEDALSAYLGPGGNVFDAPNSECYKEGQMSNLDYCKENYNIGKWILC